MVNTNAWRHGEGWEIDVQSIVILYYGDGERPLPTLDPTVRLKLEDYSNIPSLPPATSLTLEYFVRVGRKEGKASTDQLSH